MKDILEVVSDGDIYTENIENTEFIKCSIVTDNIRRHHKLNSDDINDIVRLYKSGMTITQIGERYRCSATNVYKWLKKRNVNIRPKKKYTHSVICNMAKDYENTDISTKELAKRYGLSSDHYRHLVNSCGFTRKIRTNNHPSKVAVCQIENGKIIGVFDSMYSAADANGLSVSQICRVVKGCRNTVHGYKFIKLEES